jgi:hypothetical protein
MSEWWTYRPSDFLLFSPRVYYRLIESHNSALWPLPIVFLAVAAAGLILAWRGRFGRAILLSLGLVWLFVGWSFLWSRYAAINWTASYAAPAFALEGLMLLGVAALRSPARPPSGLWRALGAALAATAILYPLAAPLAGRSLEAAEFVGATPDPTALATLGLLAILRPPLPPLLALIPALWCAYSGMTLWTMDAPEAAIVLPAAAIGLSLAAAGLRRG